ncbi:type II secretion system minor pseudopilin GspH [Vibrio sp. RC27]
MKSQQGFTLIEVLLVLAIIALTSFVVVISIPASAQDEAEQQARQLYHRISLIQDEALLSGQEFAVQVSAEQDKLTLLGMTQSGWKPLEWAKMKSEIAIADNVVLDFSLASGVWKDNDRLYIPQSFDSDTSLFEEEKESDEEPKFDPQILIMSSGEITAFSLRFEEKNNKSSGWITHVSENGTLKLTAISEVSDE